MKSLSSPATAFQPSFPTFFPAVHSKRRVQAPNQRKRGEGFGNPAYNNRKPSARRESKPTLKRILPRKKGKHQRINTVGTDTPPEGNCFCVLYFHPFSPSAHYVEAEEKRLRAFSSASDSLNTSSNSALTGFSSDKSMTYGKSFLAPSMSPFAPS